MVSPYQPTYDIHVRDWSRYRRKLDYLRKYHRTINPNLLVKYDEPFPTFTNPEDFIESRLEYNGKITIVYVRKRFLL